MERKLIALFLSFAVIAGGITDVRAEETEGNKTDAAVTETSETQGVSVQGINVEYHTEEEIRAYVNNNGPAFLRASYDVQPDTQNPPYNAGVLSQETLEDALKAVNTIRYIAGLNADVTHDDSFTEMVQAGALVNALNGKISHFPEKPEGIDDAVYELAKSGNGSANLAQGYSSLASAVTAGWLNDGDESNIDVIGHRRWLLNARMGKTGFGQVEDCTGMYAFDRSGTAGYTSNVWPAQNTPLEFFGTEYPWSVSTGSEETGNVQVTMTNRETGTVYSFSKNSADGFFTVDNDWYGVPGAVIWRPDGISYNDGDTYDVQISGLSGGDITYPVHFFKLYEEESMSAVPENLIVGIGKTETITVQFKPASSTDYVSQWRMSYSGYPKPFEVSKSSGSNEFIVSGLAAGSGVITFTSANGLSTQCNITVIEDRIPVTGITLQPQSLNLICGQSETLNAQVQPENADNQNIIWSSSDPEIAEVSQEGIVTAVHSGSAVITAKSEDGGFEAQCMVSVESEPLTAELVLPEDALAGTEIMLTASATGGTAPYSYRFTAKIDGKWITIRNTSENSECAYVFENAGTYAVNVTVTDSDGNTDKAQKTLTVREDAPVLPLSAELILPENAKAGEAAEITVDVSGGEAPYKYQFTTKIDGRWITMQKKSASAVCSHVFEEPGKYPVNVTVYDLAGNVVKSQKTLAVVSATPLEAELILPANAVAGQEVLISAEAAGGEPDYKYRFTAKVNGKWITIQETSAKSECAYTFENAGSYPVNVTVYDGSGFSVKAQKTLVVNDGSAEPLAAEIIFDPEVAAGDPVTLKTSVSGGVGPYRYQFTAKIGGKWITLYNGTKADCTYTFAEAGKYPVNVTVTDSTGARVKSQKTIVVKSS